MFKVTLYLIRGRGGLITQFFFSLADRPITRGTFENGESGGRSEFIMFSL